MLKVRSLFTCAPLQQIAYFPHSIDPTYSSFPIPAEVKRANVASQQTNNGSMRYSPHS